MSGGLAEIRGWLVKGESEAGWLGICRILEGLEASEREMLVSYVAQHTKRWGESLRRPLYEWWEKYRRGEVTGFEGLVGDWSRYAWEEGKVAGEVREVAVVAGMRVRWIPAGTFWMGSGDDDEEAPYYDERPKREVTLTRGFWMMETPVTQGQYLAVMGHNPSYFTFTGKGLTAPVERVSWYDAAAFANRLSALEGVSACFVGEGEAMDGVGNKESDYLGCKGWRLPTEAEWEYACRAGTTTPRYGELDEIAWYVRSTHEMTTHQVGLKRANAWGLYDMLGNVWEWCYDRFEEDIYGKLGHIDPMYLSDVFERVLRGASWNETQRSLRAAARSGNTPDVCGTIYGVRLLRC